MGLDVEAKTISVFPKFVKFLKFFLLATARIRETVGVSSTLTPVGEFGSVYPPRGNGGNKPSKTF